MKIERHYTKSRQTPYEDMTFSPRVSVSRNAREKKPNGRQFSPRIHGLR
jgi:hypothetical protein